MTPIEILLVEDNPGDARQTREALREAKMSNRVHLVPDGVEAMAFLRREGRYRDAPVPDVVLLDLHLPRKDGFEVLAEIRAHPAMMALPVVILTSSTAERDVLTARRLGADCYVTKPVDLEQFTRIVRSVEPFWFTIERLPRAV